MRPCVCACYLDLSFVCGGLRAATFGCALAPLTFSIAKKLGLRDSTAFVAGCCLVFDLMNTIESRLILVDSQLMFYCGLALWTALKYWKRRNEVGAPMQPSAYRCSSRLRPIYCMVGLPFPVRDPPEWCTRSRF